MIQLDCCDVYDLLEHAEEFNLEIWEGDNYG